MRTPVMKLDFAVRAAMTDKNPGNGEVFLKAPVGSYTVAELRDLIESLDAILEVAEGKKSGPRFGTRHF